MGKRVFLPEKLDPNSVAGLIKQWLRELPEPLLTYELFSEFAAVLEIEDHEERVRSLQVRSASASVSSLFSSHAL